jgi:curved DNA-binding protein CbpA
MARKLIDFNPYKALGVADDATEIEIREAHRVLAVKLHPDLEGGSEEKMRKINIARDALLDPEMRAAVDRKIIEIRATRNGRQPVSARDSSGRVSPSNLFEAFFGNTGPSSLFDYATGGAFTQAQQKEQEFLKTVRNLQSQEDRIVSLLGSRVERLIHEFVEQLSPSNRKQLWRSHELATDDSVFSRSPNMELSVDGKAVTLQQYVLTLASHLQHAWVNKIFLPRNSDEKAYVHTRGGSVEGIAKKIFGRLADHVRSVQRDLLPEFQARFGLGSDILDSVDEYIRINAYPAERKEAEKKLVSLFDPAGKATIDDIVLPKGQRRKNDPFAEHRKDLKALVGDTTFSSLHACIRSQQRRSPYLGARG